MVMNRGTQAGKRQTDERAGYDFVDGAWQELVQREMRPAMVLSEKALALLDELGDDDENE